MKRNHGCRDENCSDCNEECQEHEMWHPGGKAQTPYVKHGGYVHKRWTRPADGCPYCKHPVPSKEELIKKARMQFITESPDVKGLAQMVMSYFGTTQAYCRTCRGRGFYTEVMCGPHVQCEHCNGTGRLDSVLDQVAEA